MNDPELNAAIANLPSNYSFEVHKCVWHLRKASAKSVALQFPEGLLLFSQMLADIFAHFCGVRCTIMGDVTYGACCVDDFTASRLGCDFLIHYGHSCLVPINRTLKDVRMLYVFVEIAVDNEHLVQLVRHNFAPETAFALMGTIQFVAVLQHAKAALTEYTGMYIPQCRPLSPGEVLGCTSPKLPDGTTTLIFVADGRFHLEASMIANPTVRAFRYDPYSKKMTSEHYDHKAMRAIRKDAIDQARAGRSYGLILGTLGRQGSPIVMRDLKAKIKAAGHRCTSLLMSEMKPEKLAYFGDQVDVWVQVACPRLSIDWGHKFCNGKPLLSPYEANVVLGHAAPFWAADEEDRVDLEARPYPMDFYSKDSSGPWTVNYTPPRQA